MTQQQPIMGKSHPSLQNKPSFYCDGKNHCSFTELFAIDVEILIREE